MKLLVWMLLTAVSFAQVPSGVTINRVEATDTVLLYWLPIAGATYNVYDANREFAPSCPTAAPSLPDQTGLTQNFYADNPAPGWDMIPETGNWKARVWCYWVSAVVNGTESEKAGPFQVAIGESGYLSLSFANDGPDPTNPCNSAPVIALPSTNATDYQFQAIYRDSAGINHQIPISPVIFNGGKTAEVEWKLPVQAADGTMIPWDPTHVFYGLVTYKPTGATYEYSWAPTFNRDLSWYNQASLRSLVSNPKIQCPMAETNLWQNVTK